MTIMTAAIEMLMTALSVTAVFALLVVVIPRHRDMLWPCLIIYAICVLYITLFSRVAAEEGQGINLLPFRFVYWIIQYAKGPTYHGVFRPILGVYMNILMFAPLGFLFKCIHENTATWRIVVTGLIVSLLIEVAQMIFHLGMFETDDLLTNTLGTWLGTLIYQKLMRKI